MNYRLTDEKVDNRQGIRLISDQFWKYKRQLLAILLCLLISTAISIFMPQLLKYAIDDAIVKKDTGKLWFISINFLVLLSILAIVLVQQMRLTGKLAQKVLTELRTKVFAKLQELPMEFFSHNQSGDIIQRLTGNVEGINRFFSEGFVRLVNIIFSVVGFLAVMIIMNPLLGGIVALTLLIIILFLVIQGRVLARLMKSSLDNEGRLSSQIQEILNGFPIVKIYEKESEFENTFTTQNRLYLNSVNKVNRVSAISEGFLPFIFAVSTLGVVLVALTFYTAGTMTAGDVIAYLTYVVTFFRRFDGIAGLWGNIQSGLASAARINELLRFSSDINNIENPYSPVSQDVKGKIEFKDVSFGYDEENLVLKNINLDVEPGQTIAIVGPTGGGKTSFVSLIARLYDISEGEILIDGVNIKHWKLDTLRKSIGYLIQETVFFSGTLLSNLTYNNPEISESEVQKVLTELGGDTILTNLAEGLNTVITPDSKILSAGQRQILALARLILRNPKILILDEATANIDTQSEKTIQKAIEIARKDKTTFIIAHRLSTVFNADKIILIQNNVILESGSHEELIAKQGKYYDIYSKFIGNKTQEEPSIIS
jgi:ATP-binding cassette subfamily B protein